MSNIVKDIVSPILIPLSYKHDIRNTWWEQLNLRYRKWKHQKAEISNDS